MVLLVLIILMLLLWRETWKTEQITVDGEKVTTYVPGDMKGNPDLNGKLLLVVI